MEILRKIFRFFVERPKLRLAVQICVSLAFLGLVIYVAQHNNLLDSIRSLNPQALLIASLVYLLGYGLNARRWQLLLLHYDIRSPYQSLLSVYFIGLFCSLFLPTGTGGDAVRVYDIARRTGRTAETIIATLQERLFGLGSSILIGLLATFAFLYLLPPDIRAIALLAQILGLILVAVLIQPKLVIGAFLAAWDRTLGKPLHHHALRHHPMLVRISASLQTILAMPSLGVVHLLHVGVVTLGASLLGIAAYYVLGTALGILVDPTVYCLVVPLVWIVRMAPISLGGIGVGEGAFVFLMGLFGVSSGPAVALALGILAIQTSLALFGGLLIVVRMIRGTWPTFTASQLPE